MNQQLIALIIFAATYLLIVLERPHRTLAALLGASAMIVSGVLDQHQAQAAVDWNVIALLAGMMVLVNALENTGAFERAATTMARWTRGRPAALFALFFALTAVASALLDNVTTVLVVCPLTLVIAGRLGVNPMPWLLGEVMASNIGGTATLIGDPPNIMIGSAVGLDFIAFVKHLAPVALIIGVVVAAGMALSYRREWRAAPVSEPAGDALAPPGLRAGRRTVVLCLAALALVIAGFLAQGVLGLEAGTIALAGAVLLMVVAKMDVQQTLAAVQWPTLFFFVGLFVVVEGVQKTGVLSQFGGWLVDVSGGNLLLAALGLLWGTALASAVVDNIPATAALIPAVKAMSVGLHPGAAAPWQSPEIMPLWWALALGACLGGNATIVGASANVVAAGIAERSGQPFGFARFMRAGVPVTLVSLAISSLYLYLRYFR